MAFSKIFGPAGLRLGYAVADRELVHDLHSAREPFNVNRAALAAGLASLGGIATVPSSANFVLVDLGVDDGELAALLLRRGILIRPGSELGLPGWARITVAPDEVMDRAAAALLGARAELVGAGASAAS
jgi:histidinol-phosphate aminotransferase